jgi:hypothetical protein
MVEESIGNLGTFYYPKLDLIATLLMIKDLVNLPGSEEGFKKAILDLTARPQQIIKETGPMGDFEIQYDLAIKNYDASHV